MPTPFTAGSKHGPNELELLEPLPPYEGEKAWTGMFMCTCGKTFQARITFVRSGNTKSCGHLRGRHDRDPAKLAANAAKREAAHQLKQDARAKVKKAAAAMPKPTPRPKPGPKPKASPARNPFKKAK